MSVQQLLSMQQGAGNAAVSSFIGGQRDGGGSAVPAAPGPAPADEHIMAALAGVASRGAGGEPAAANGNGAAISAALAAENPDLAQTNGHSPDSAAAAAGQ